MKPHSEFISHGFQKQIEQNRLLSLRQNILLKPLFIYQDKAINAQGPPLLLITHSPSYTYEVYTMLLG